MSRERQTFIIIGVALVLVAIAIYAPVSGWLRGSSRPAPLLTSYRVIYRVDLITGDTTRWEVLSVDRPFESSDLFYDEPPSPGLVARSGSAATADGLYEVNGGGPVLVAGRQPGLPPGDQVLLRDMPELLNRQLARRQSKTGLIAGRSCHLYTLFEPPVGPIHPLANRGDHDEICVDGNGLVLSERWTFHGQLVETRQALSVETPSGPTVAGFGHASGGGAVGASAPSVVAESSPDTFLARPPAPRGFQSRTPVRFTLPDPQQPQNVLAVSVVWSFVRGPEVLTVEAGSESQGQLPWQPDDTVTRPVDLTGLGPADTAIRSDGVEVRVDLTSRGLGWVRVRGSERLTDVVRLANQLRLKVPAA